MCMFVKKQTPQWMLVCQGAGLLWTEPYVTVMATSKFNKPPAHWGPLNRLRRWGASQGKSRDSPTGRTLGISSARNIKRGISWGQKSRCLLGVVALALPSQYLGRGGRRILWVQGRPGTQKQLGYTMRPCSLQQNKTIKTRPCVTTMNISYSPKA